MGQDYIVDLGRANPAWWGALRGHPEGARIEQAIDRGDPLTAGDWALCRALPGWTEDTLIEVCAECGGSGVVDYDDWSRVDGEHVSRARDCYRCGDGGRDGGDE